MKKFFSLMLTAVVLAVSFVFVAPVTLATDVCSNDAHSGADFYVETSKASWLMSQSCVDSNVVTTMPVGSVMHVVGKTEGWHKLVTEDGHEGWMWEDFVTSTSKTFSPVGSEPEPQPEPEPEPEVIEYVAMRDIGGHKYEDAVWYVYNNEIVEGYEDGSYKPDTIINRAELLKIIVESAYTTEFESYEGQSCFSDVSANQWYAKYVCFAEDEGIVKGYNDGSFKPAQEINFVEALKIAMVGFEYGYEEGDMKWYSNIVDEASEYNFIPLDVDAFDEKFTRAQMAELITRMMKYEEGTLAEYLGQSQSYKVTYESINAGMNVESYVGTGDCVYKDKIIADGEKGELGVDEYCTCTNGEITSCVK